VCNNCGSKAESREECSLCGYVHRYDGVCDSCNEGCFVDDCCYVICDKYCIEHSSKCTGISCPSCKEVSDKDVLDKEVSDKDASSKKESYDSSCSSSQKKPGVQKPNAPENPRSHKSNSRY
jgi:hypothetical protein